MALDNFDSKKNSNRVSITNSNKFENTEFANLRSEAAQVLDQICDYANSRKEVPKTKKLSRTELTDVERQELQDVEEVFNFQKTDEVQSLINTLNNFGKPFTCSNFLWESFSAFNFGHVISCQIRETMDELELKMYLKHIQDLFHSNLATSEDTRITIVKAFSKVFMGLLNEDQNLAIKIRNVSRDEGEERNIKKRIVTIAVNMFLYFIAIGSPEVILKKKSMDEFLQEKFIKKLFYNLPNIFTQHCTMHSFIEETSKNFFQLDVNYNDAIKNLANKCFGGKQEIKTDILVKEIISQIPDTPLLLPQSLFILSGNETKEMWVSSLYAYLTRYFPDETIPEIEKKSCEHHVNATRYHIFELAKMLFPEKYSNIIDYRWFVDIESTDDMLFPSTPYLIVKNIFELPKYEYLILTLRRYVLYENYYYKIKEHYNKISRIPIYLQKLNIDNIRDTLLRIIGCAVMDYFSCGKNPFQLRKIMKENYDIETSFTNCTNELAMALKCGRALSFKIYSLFKEIGIEWYDREINASNKGDCFLFRLGSVHFSPQKLLQKVKRGLPLIGLTKKHKKSSFDSNSYIKKIMEVTESTIDKTKVNKNFELDQFKENLCNLIYCLDYDKAYLTDYTLSVIKSNLIINKEFHEDYSKIGEVLFYYGETENQYNKNINFANLPYHHKIKNLGGRFFEGLESFYNSFISRVPIIETCYYIMEDLEKIPDDYSLHSLNSIPLDLIISMKNVSKFLSLLYKSKGDLESCEVLEKKAAMYENYIQQKLSTLQESLKYHVPTISSLAQLQWIDHHNKQHYDSP